MTEYQIIISACFSLLSAIIASGLTGWITYKFAIKRHRSERVWEIKTEAYQEIMSLLHSRKYYTKHFTQKNYQETRSNKRKFKELVEFGRQASNDLRRLTEVKSLLLTEESIKLIMEFDNDLNDLVDTRLSSIRKDEEVHVFAQDAIALINQCMSSFQKLVRQDLK
jgi:hypothetical protein